MDYSIGKYRITNDTLIFIFLGVNNLKEQSPFPILSDTGYTFELNGKSYDMSGYQLALWIANNKIRYQEIVNLRINEPLVEAPEVLLRVGKLLTRSSMLDYVKQPCKSFICMLHDTYVNHKGKVSVTITFPSHIKKPAKSLPYPFDDFTMPDTSCLFIPMTALRFDAPTSPVGIPSSIWEPEKLHFTFPSRNTLGMYTSENFRSGLIEELSTGVYQVKRDLPITVKNGYDYFHFPIPAGSKITLNL